jgi:hypothetical protein
MPLLACAVIVEVEIPSPLMVVGLALTVMVSGTSVCVTVVVPGLPPFASVVLIVHVVATALDPAIALDV